MTRREAAVAPAESATGAIYDLGYQGYDGPRLGRRAAFWTLFWASLRACFGLGRSGRAKVAPWGLTAIVIIPAAIALSTAVPSAPSSYTIASPRAATISSGVPSPASRPSNT